MSASAVVLAGGRSRRMGRAKASLPFGDETLLQRVVRLVAPLVAELVVVGHSAATLPATVRVIADPVEGEGPLAGLVTGLDAIVSPRVVLVACDMPLLVPPVIGRLLALQRDADACVPRIAGVPVPTCAVYAAAVAPVARQRLASGDRSMRGLLRELTVRWVEEEELRDVDPELHSFRDCDTPEEYAAALALLRVSGS